jgi:type IV fimbrial biogenesis protein FimT
MVTVVLVGILAMFAYPSFSGFIQNGQIRASAESVMSGLQLARAESIRRNEIVEFRLLNTLRGAAVAGGTDWSVLTAAPETPTVFDQVVQTRREESSSSIARAGVADTAGAVPAAAGAGLPSAIAFTGLGRLSMATSVRQIDVTGPAGARPLRITLDPGGDIRLCDPALALASHPQGCA